MKALSALFCSGAAVLLLSGCVGYGDHGHHYPGNYYDGSYSGGYYDGYYGPYSGGYWASDGYFYYMDRDHHYRRDNGRHFRHNRFPGGTAIRTDDRRPNRAYDRNYNRDSYDKQDGDDQRNRNDSEH